MTQDNDLTPSQQKNQGQKKGYRLDPTAGDFSEMLAASHSAKGGTIEIPSLGITIGPLSESRQQELRKKLAQDD